MKSDGLPPTLALTVRWPPLGGTDFEPSLRLVEGRVVATTSLRPAKAWIYTMTDVLGLSDICTIISR